MGVNLIAVGGHNISLDNIEKVANDLTQKLPIDFIVNNSTRYWASNENYKVDWKLKREFKDKSLTEEFAQLGEIQFDSDYYLIYFGQKSFSIICYLRYKNFLLDNQLQKDTRLNFLKIAKCFTSNELLYLPDSSSKLGGIDGLITFGLSFNEIKDRAIQGFGEPSELSKSQEQISSFPDLYFVDNFEDLVM